MADTHTFHLNIKGMSCGGCVRKVEKALESVGGVKEATVSLTDRSAAVETTGNSSTPLVQAVKKAGYSASEQSAQAPTASDGGGFMFVQALVAGLVGFPIMGAMWVGLISGKITQPQDPFWLAILFTSLAAMAFSGWHIYKDFIKQTLRLSANMNTLVGLGTLAAWAYSAVVIFNPQLMPEEGRYVFIEASLIILSLVNVGHGLEARARGKTSKAIRKLLDLTPKTAMRVDDDGNEEEVAVKDLQQGDKVRIKPGENIPVDGEVLEGGSEVDESLITGESQPIAKETGDTLVAGSLNKQGTLLIETTATGDDTALSNIVAMVRKAQSSKPPIGRLVDKVAAYFSLSVLLIAALTFAVWWQWGPDPQLPFAFTTALAVLVIACPCALGLATPISIMVGVGLAARHGVLIRHGDALQTASKVTHVVFDKTGTLTSGKHELIGIACNGKWQVTDVVKLAAGAEEGSEHSLARAIAKKAKDENIKPAKASDFEAITGRGIKAEVDGKTVVIGNSRLMRSENIDFRPLRDKANSYATEKGATTVYMGVDGEVVAVFAMIDAPRDDAVKTVEKLRSMGIRVYMLSGDRETTARAIAENLKIRNVMAEVLPEDKQNKIKSLQKEGAIVAMIGDGVNDAPALAQANVGIAMGKGTDVAIESAGITLKSDELYTVVKTIELSRATMRNIKQNLLGAFGYNALGIPIAAGVLFPFTGWLLSPIIAGAAMAFSSVTVVTNASRLRFFQPSKS